MRNWTTYFLLVTSTSLGFPLISAEPPNSVSLIERTSCAHLYLAHGRLQLDGSRYCKLRREEPIQDSAGTEFVCVSAQHGIPSLHYVRQTPDYRMSMDFVDAGTVTIDWIYNHGPRAGTQFHALQAKDCPISVSLEYPSAAHSNSSVVKESYPSFWHLYAAEPELFRQWLTPIFDNLNILGRPNQQFLAEVDGYLRNSVVRTERIHADDVRNLVAQLSGKSLEQRNAAQYELLKHGVTVLPFLADIDNKTLDAEQKLRVKHLTKRLQPHVADHPEAVAHWLLGDYGYWQIAATRWHPTDRALASQHASKTWGRAFSTDLNRSKFLPREPIAAVAQIPATQFR